MMPSEEQSYQILKVCKWKWILNSMKAISSKQKILKLQEKTVKIKFLCSLIRGKVSPFKSYENLEFVNVQHDLMMKASS